MDGFCASEPLLFYLDGLFTKSYSYAFMKIVLYEKQSNEKQHLKKIRHYDIESQAVNRISDIIKQKIYNFKASTFLLLKYHKYATPSNKKSHKSSIQKLTRTKIEKKLFSARRKTQNRSALQNYEEQEHLNVTSGKKKYSKSVLDQPETADKQKLISSRICLVKPTNKQKTNIHAQKLSYLLDKARYTNCNQYMPTPIQLQPQFSKLRVNFPKQSYIPKKKKTLSERMYEKRRTEEKDEDLQSCKLSMDININIYQNDEKAYSYQWKATPNIRFFNKSRRNDHSQHF